jgi:hypothetical protein
VRVLQIAFQLCSQLEKGVFEVVHSISWKCIVNEHLKFGAAVG